MRYLCFGALLLLISVTEAEAGHAYLGVGSESCGTWIEARKSTGTPRVLQLRAWLFGFVSGVNNASQFEGELFGAEDADGLVAYIDKHCANDPLDALGEASNALVKELLVRGLATGKLKFNSTAH